ncbi:uncharacterized protein LOC124448463 [Xenia sp. Carnegie-2017]|uniref:uncharacterized protein LOC124448463 n=1 Tax=Xenia sp. Carnegie-2017 TaxID=2897299 RepID=UPI001F044308|nr:uncharacterized protein LOC124448463 [Xenia sp. Carnegie-2017]
MESKEERNWNYLYKMITDVVRKELADLFIQEWNRTAYGEWDNTVSSGQKLYNIELTRCRPNKSILQSNFQSGNTSSWDCSTLFDAILYSNAIGHSLKMCNKKIWDSVNDLRLVRNTIIHEKQGNLSEIEFQDLVDKIEKSFRNLNFSQDKIIYMKTERNKFNSFLVLPCKPNHYVVERTALRDQIIEDLKKLRNDNNNELTYFYISGNPGSGKSQLARQVCKEKFESFDWQNQTTFVWTLDGKDKESLFKNYLDLCYRINCDNFRIKQYSEENLAITEKIKNLLSLLLTRINLWRNWWIIVDNVAQPNKIHPLLPKIGEHGWMNGQIILTVQNTEGIPHKEVLSRHVSISHGMNDKECFELLNHYTEDKNADVQLLNDVIDTLHRQPLALAAAGYYVDNVNKANCNFTWKQYLEKLSSGKQEEMDKTLAKDNTEYSKTMLQAAVLAVEINAQNSLILANVFKFFSLLSFHPLPRDIIVKYIQSTDVTQSVEDICLALEHCSLFTYSENEDICLHRVFHEAMIVYQRSFSHKKYETEHNCNSTTFEDALSQVIEALHSFKDRKDQVKLIPHLEKFLTLNLSKIKVDLNSVEALKFLEGALRDFKKLNLANQLVEKIMSKTGESNFNEKTWCFIELSRIYYYNQEYEQANFFNETAMEFLKKSSNPIVVAKSLNILGNLHSEKREYKRSEEFYKKALELRKKLLGPDHVEVADSLCNLGILYYNCGKYETSENYHKEALEMRKKLLGPDHVKVADSLNSLGILYTKTGEYEKSENYHKEALEMRKKLLGPDHVDVANSLCNLGILYYNCGKYEKSENYLKEALEMRKKLLGPDHVDVANSLQSLGFYYYNCGKYEKSANYYKEALEMRKKLLGPDHVKVVNSFKDLGGLYKIIGEYKKSQNYYKEALEMQKKLLGPDHVEVANSINNLGILYSNSGKYEKSENHYKEALEMRKKLFGPDHVEVANSINNLGNLYSSCGKYEKSENYYKEALEMRKKLLGKDHVDVANSLYNLGILNDDCGKYEKSENYYKEALEMRKNLLGPDHVDVANSLNNLGVLYMHAGENEKSEEYHKRALEMRKKLLGKDHVDVANSLNNLGLLYRHAGENEKSEEYHKRALEMRKKLLGSDDVKVATSLNNLGILYEDTLEYEKSENCHKEALEMRKKLLGLEHVDVACSLYNLGTLYYNCEKYEKSENCHKEALEMRKKLLGPDHVEVANSLNNLGALYTETGEYEKSENCHKEALEMRKKLLGSDHVDVADSLYNLGYLYYKCVKYEKIENYYKEALEMRKKLLGPDHVKVATSLNNLGVLYTNTGEYEKSENCHKEALKMRKKLLGPDHIEVSRSLKNLGNLYTKTGEYEKSENYYKEALKIRKKLFTAKSC